MPNPRHSEPAYRSFEGKFLIFLKNMETIVHRDQKIGLALGVLLIGAVAAFFFRNERSTMDGVPVISDVVELDAVIAEKSFRPYLGMQAALQTGLWPVPSMIPSSFHR